MARFSGFKHTTFKASLVCFPPAPAYKGRAICFEDGRRLWQETSKIFRMSRGDALTDAKRMSGEYLAKRFNATA